MYVFKSNVLDKQIGDLHNRADFVSRFNNVLKKLLQYQTIDDLYKDKALGFKKYKGTDYDVYGIDLGTPNSASMAGERLIVSIINLYENNLFKKTVEYQSESHNAPTVLLLFYSKHDVQNKEAARVDDEYIQNAFNADEINNLSLSLLSTSKYQIVHDEYDAPSVTVLTLDKDEIVDYYISNPTPTILQGVAGSGKTEVLIKLMQTIHHQNPQAKLLYVTHSDKLAAEVERKLDLPEKTQMVQTFKGLLRSFLPQSQREKEHETYNDFCRFLTGGIDFNSKKIVDRLFKEAGNDTYKLYCEVYGLLFGHMLPEWNRKSAGMLSHAEYMTLPEDYRLFPGSEDLVYKIGELYLKWLPSQNLLSSNAECFTLIGTAKPLYDYVFVDEVQDFTQCQIKWLTALVKEDRLFFCGDTKQIINPTFFDFGQLKRLLTTRNPQKGAKVHDLRANFRNSESVTELINSLNNIRQEHLPSQKVEDRQAESSANPVPGNAYSFSGDAEPLIEFFSGPTDAVIVDESELRALKQKGVDTTNLYTIRECKGIEFDNVCAFNLLSQKTDFFETIIHSDKIKDYSLHYHFNLYYVAITRSKNCLVLYETTPRDFYKALLKPTNTVLEAQSVAEIDKKADKSAKAFCDQALRLIENGLYEKAQMLFIKAQHATEAQIMQKAIEEGLKITKIYTTVSGDARLAHAFEEASLYAYAYKHYKQLNDYPQMALMLLMEQHDDEFAQAVIQNHLDAWALVRQNPLYEVAFQEFLDKKNARIAQNVADTGVYAALVSQTMHTIHL